jgi:hypothetical protein
MMTPLSPPMYVPYVYDGPLRDPMGRMTALDLAVSVV